MNLIAHRGASAEAPENTLAALRVAWDCGADGVEIDLRLTRDGEVVVIHDPLWVRTTGHPGVVADTACEDVANLDAGAWFGEAFRGEPVPRFGDVLKALPPGKILLAEVKTGDDIIEPLKPLVRKAQRRELDLRFLSFDPAVAAALKRSFPELSTLLNVEPDAQKGLSPKRRQELIKNVQGWAIDGVSLGFTGEATVEMVRCAREADLETAVWVIDDPVHVAALEVAGVDNLMTNDPRRMRSAVR